MEKEKMIEEMTENGLCCIACEMCDETLENGKFIKAECLESGHTNNCSISKHVAEAFIDAGYRKVPEGSVVLTKEEWERIQKELLDFDKFAREISNIRMQNGEPVPTEKTFLKYIGELKEQARNETKREVLKKLDGFRFVMYDEGYEVASWTCGEDDVKQFAKEIGVEVEE